MDKTAETEFPVMPAIAARWSPRAFADRPVEPEKLRSLFEAARWSASSYNEQPWRFVVATRDQSEAFEKALGCLVEANQAWARAAPVLVLTFTSEKFSKNEKPNRVALHDLGLAMGNLSLQATELGLVVHQMAGVNLSQMRSAYAVPEGFEPQTACAIGYEGDADSLPEPWMREAEKAERTRMAFDEFVFGGRWGEASGLF